MFSRRDIIIGTGALAAGCALSAIPGGIASGVAPSPKAASGPSVKEASWWEPLESRRVKCTLCPRECAVADAERGWCGVRENRDGKYYTLVHSRPSAIHIDPIEKKPLFHYLPGTKSFSIGTAGCNLECKFCQNWNISQMRPEQVKSYDLPPGAVVASAREGGCGSIACTYNEPVIFSEYVLDCARASRAVGLPTVMVSDGYIQKTPMETLCGELGAVKIDLKSYSEKFYADICRGKLQPVLDTLKTLKASGIWFEIVCLLVTGLNDSPDEIKRLSQWVVTELSPDVPLHFSRYFPYYQLQLPPTPVDTMGKAWETAVAEGCNYVYVGNIELPGKADTICPSCRAVCIQRMGMMVLANKLKDGACPKCSRAIAGVWRKEDAFSRT
jgi:pyruvate formate lyase activating enzyme